MMLEEMFVGTPAERRRALKKYSCNECANRATPLCRACTAVEKPSGSCTRPTGFVRTVARDKVFCDEDVEEVAREVREAREDIALATEILGYLLAEKPIPIATVMRFNGLCEVEDEEI